MAGAGAATADVAKVELANPPLATPNPPPTAGGARAAVAPNGLGAGAPKRPVTAEGAAGWPAVVAPKAGAGVVVEVGAPNDGAVGVAAAKGLAIELALVRCRRGSQRATR